jgi:hypothetical protein
MANIEIHSEHPRKVENVINTHALISYRAIVAGLLISMLAMIGLIGLGLGFGGIGLDEETSAHSVGVFSGIWFVVSVLLSLFIGSYFASRVSKFRTARVGSVQGLVIAALFLGFFFYQIISGLASAGSAIGSLVGKSGGMIAQGTRMASQHPTVTNTINNLAEDVLGELNLRSSPQVVAQGLGSRIIRGDTEGAKNYLALEAGITPTEADNRIAQVKAKVDQYLADIKEGTGMVLRSTGWSLFLMVLLGALSAIFGGAIGAKVNFRKPLILEREEHYPTGQAA